MSFNPISLEEDGHPTYPNGVANTAVGHGDASSGFLSRHASFGDALRACRNAFHFHTSWSVPYPEVPASPMLYYPEEYQRMVESTMPLGIMQSELDAMQAGLLDSIPLAYYPLEPNAIEEVRRALKALEASKKRAALTAETEGDGAAASSSASAAGTATRPEPLLSRLDPGDAEIARIVVDANELQVRNLPSLTHVQRPLYTDIGLVSQEERHAARVARTRPREAPPSDVSLGPAEVLRSWRHQVEESFTEATRIDAGFARFVEEVAHAKLGLDREDAAHLRLTRAIWAALFRGTSKRQQRGVWYALCHFSSVFSDSSVSDAAAAQLLRAVEALGLPCFATTWHPLLREYIGAVRRYVTALPGGVEQRRGHLQFHDRELDQLYNGHVYTNIELDGKLLRASADRLKNVVYPVEVIPVYPSGYQQTVVLGSAAVQLHDSEELDYLAERGSAMHHVILPDAVLPKAAAARPNMLVGGCNLLIAEDGDLGDVEPGSTLRYSVSAENTYQTLRQDPANTASYLLRVEQETTDAGKPLGCNADGRYVTYDRIGHRDIYQKTNSTDTHALSRYVVLFSDAQAAGAGAEPTVANTEGDDRHGRGVKREREELLHAEGETSEAAAQNPRLE